MVQVEPEHYFRAGYDTKERFISYWHQIDEIVRLKPDSVLEIGVGNRMVSDYLKKRGFSVTTMDIDERLEPDVTGDIVAIPFEADHFDAVACYEILEHIPYEKFAPALREIRRVTRKHAIISLPDVSRCYRVSFQLPKIGHVDRLVEVPRMRKPAHQFDGEHYWELGKAGYPLKRIIGEMEAAGFILEREYRVSENPIHHFFVLKKR